MPAPFLVDTATKRTPGRNGALHLADILSEAWETSPRTAMPTSLLVDGVSKRFVSKRGEVLALHDVSLEIATGEFVCLIGPSGCGKSTLLDIMAGLTQPDKGSVWSEGIRVTGPARDRLVMFQDSALFPWLDAFGNVMFGLKLKPGTELYLGLVHFTDGVEGARRRLAAAKRVVTDFGVATECGLGRRTPAPIPPLLALHREVAELG